MEVTLLVHVYISMVNC